MLPGYPGSMSVTLAAVCFALAFLLAVVLAIAAPSHPRLSHIPLALVALGLLFTSLGK